MTNAAPVSIAIIGPLCDDITHTIVHFSHLNRTQEPFSIKVFLPINDNLLHLLALCPESTHSQLNGIKNIHGCHRFTLENFNLDIYLGDTNTLLKQQVCASSKRISYWHISDTAPLSTEACIWSMASLSGDDCTVSIDSASLPRTTKCDAIENSTDTNTELFNILNQSGFRCLLLTQDNHPKAWQCVQNTQPSHLDADIAIGERQALRTQQASNLAYLPLKTANDEIAIIGGGIAAATLCLSLAQRNKSLHFFCMDEKLGQQASGNKQGAIYPLLTPDNGPLSQFFQQGLLFSLRQISQLSAQGFNISHDFCGVLQTGHDERSRQRLQKIIQGFPWPSNMAQAVDAEQANILANIAIDQAGIYYPQSGWVAPQQYAQAAYDSARQLTDISAHFNCQIIDIEKHPNGWLLLQRLPDGTTKNLGPYRNLVVANGRNLTQFAQTKHLAVSGFRGQVSHIPSQGQLSQLQTVLCSHGYLTPSHQQSHCTGASYVKNPQDLNFNADEQQQNLAKLQQSYPNSPWVEDVDISDNSARVGVRMVTRDHAPMVGCAPDYNKILQAYERHQHSKQSIQYWQNTPAPVHDSLFVLGGLGSRGLTSGPLAAEILAAQLCDELIPTDIDTLKMLNPNRMWMRKLLKGKALEASSNE
ncbi:FAD-dependent 5-carboxymethylaminomethyl-2-thiouridine(34) oxidoreductase MnmC [Shewanella waksmanii]|uniref:FAD-dependent 5-carboxymethylaminomethyl-2-thiouridine(34) oxidoreductase MnmC n=1 Tax=Shewanella waksmanii TaxID=213783 RepID=UPI00373545A4